MIKELIKDLAYDKITLSQGLTRAKIIAYKVRNTLFQDWIRKELEGYIFHDSTSPSYRIIPCTVRITTIDDWGGNRQTQYVSFDKFGEKTSDMLDKQHIKHSISVVEETYSKITSQTAFHHFSPSQIEMLEKLFKIREQGGRIDEAGQEINTIQLKDIIDQTKQKLLDTLLELDTEFPNLENEFVMSEDSSKKVNNIITNNIYGDSNPLLIAAGDSVVQSGNTITISDQDYEKLESLGIGKHQIDQLKTIVSESKQDKKSFKEKAFTWLGSVASSLAAKGLAENIPAISDFITSHI